MWLLALAAGARARAHAGTRARSAPLPAPAPLPALRTARPAFPAAVCDAGAACVCAQAAPPCAGHRRQPRRAGRCPQQVGGSRCAGWRGCRTRGSVRAAAGSSTPSPFFFSKTLTPRCPFPLAPCCCSIACSHPSPRLRPLPVHASSNHLQVPRGCKGRVRVALVRPASCAAWRHCLPSRPCTAPPCGVTRRALQSALRRAPETPQSATSSARQCAACSVTSRCAPPTTTDGDCKRPSTCQRPCDRITRLL